MKREWFFIALVILLAGLGAGLLQQQIEAGKSVPDRERLASVRYETGTWEESGYGNHRAVIHVAKEDTCHKAVRVVIPWRRTDSEPEKKALLLYGRNNVRIGNMVPMSFSPDKVEIAFQPLPNSTEYYLYYMPYELAKEQGQEHYMTPVQTADEAWIRQVRASSDRLPQVQLHALQARNDFHRFDPMEVPATEDEVACLLKEHSGKDYLVFPEDRHHDIRMKNRLPLRWISPGPSNDFTGKARPGEYYVFQLGIWNCGMRPLRNFQIRLKELSDGNGSLVPAKRMTCFNTEGVDMSGKAFAKCLTIDKGQVQPLWIGIDLPENLPAGTYRGVWELHGKECQSERVTIDLSVAGKPMKNGGLDQVDNLGRLKWLNSTRGLDDQLLPGFEPVRYNKGVCTLGRRRVIFNEDGLPESITSNGRELLSAPMALKADGQKLSGKSLPVIRGKNTQSLKELCHDGALGKVTVRSKAVVESDGCLQFHLALTPSQKTQWQNLILEIPLQSEVAKYWMGMEKRGGLRKGNLNWKWRDGNYLGNAIWLGDFNAGMQLKLQSPTDPWSFGDPIPYESGMLWNQTNQGGCRSVEKAGTLMLQAYTGPVTLPANQETVLRFRLLVTPFKKITNRHWNYRILDSVASTDNKIFHMHHGSWYMPYINYPFSNFEALKGFVKGLRQPREIKQDQGTLVFNLQKVLNGSPRSIHLETVCQFDDRKETKGSGDSNHELAILELGKAIGRVYVYWNVDDNGIRLVLQRGAVTSQNYPATIWGTKESYRPGDRHVVSFGWDKERIRLAVDGRDFGSAPLAGFPIQDVKSLKICGDGFTTVAVRADRTMNLLPAPDMTTGQGSAAFWRLAQMTQKEASQDSRLTMRGRLEWTPEGVRPSSRTVTYAGREAQVYYTVRELSNHARELWAFRSLGDEIYQTFGEGMTYDVGGVNISKAGTGHPWLQEHLHTDYVPAWRTFWLPAVGLPGDFCAAIQTKSNSRLMNYYLESMHYLFRETGMQGLYLDGIGYNRDIMKRVARSLNAARRDYRINFHCSDLYERFKISVMNHNMEHLPYLTDLWLGEYYQYSKSPDYYLIEISGIPFGVTNEMLNYSNGGNAWRGMVFGMTGRGLPDVGDMWRFWDEFGIDKTNMLGYYDPACPVKTSNDEIKATCYVKQDAPEALIAVAHWPKISDGSRRRQAQIPCVDKNEAVVEKGARLSRFRNFSDSTLLIPEEQTLVHAAALPQGLSIDFECYQRQPIQAKQRPKDGPVWEDDAMELFIQPDPQAKTYYQFVINAENSQWDSEGRNGGWNGLWRSSASKASSGWKGHFLIPWKTLGMNGRPEGKTLGVNLCRDHGNQPSCYGYPESSYHNLDGFSLWQIGTNRTLESLPDSGECQSVISFKLSVDKAIFPDFSPENYELYQPPIRSFQKGSTYRCGDTIQVNATQGCLLWLRPVSEKTTSRESGK